MRTRFQQGLDELREKLLRMGGLAEQSHAWVPGRLAAVEQPSPVGSKRQQQPHGPVQRRREMGGEGIDTDHQCHIDQVRCGVEYAG